MDFWGIPKNPLPIRFKRVERGARFYSPKTKAVPSAGSALTTKTEESIWQQ